MSEHIWGADSDTLEGVVGHLLSSRGMSLAVAETVTAGLLSFSLASHPESRGHFKGGMTVTPGAEASISSASGMASSVRCRFATDIGLAVDGYLETSASPATIRVFIAVDSGATVNTAARSYSGAPQQVMRRAVNHALVKLRDSIPGA